MTNEQNMTKTLLKTMENKRRNIDKKRRRTMEKTNERNVKNMKDSKMKGKWKNKKKVFGSKMCLCEQILRKN